MHIEEFLSKGYYVALPTKNNPKVYINVSSAANSKMGFGLYNPFSWKARLLKSGTNLLYSYANYFTKKIFSFSKSENETFIKEIERTLETNFQSSIYISTNKQKLVIQLISNNMIYGYVKFPLNDLGQVRILNEKNALEKLIGLRLAPKLLHTGTYEGKTYILTENIQGNIGHVEEDDWKSILNQYQKKNTFKLQTHPRITKLRLNLENNGLLDILKLINEGIKSGKDEYLEVFEHGDFAPWNLIQTKENILPFDYEYFEENGLQFLDELMYHFRVITLLKGKKGQAIIDELRMKFNRSDFEILFKIFLAKEILICKTAGEKYKTELNLLELLK